MPTIEFVSKVPPPKVGRSSRRISGLVSVPAAVVGGRVVVAGAAVVVVVGGRVVGGVVADDGGVDVVCWLVVDADVVELEAVFAVEAMDDAVLTDWSSVEEVVGASVLEAAVCPSPSTVTTRAPAG